MNESQNGRGRLLKNDVQMVKRVSTKSIHKSLLSNVATWGYMALNVPFGPNGPENECSWKKGQDGKKMEV